MAGRCNSTTKLEIHHIYRTGGNVLKNAEVLCHSCHTKTSTYGVPGTSPPEFPEGVKNDILRMAGGRCQCMKNNCH